MVKSESTRASQVRALLKQNPEGLTIPEMASLLEVPPGRLAEAPRSASGVYLASWDRRFPRGKPTAVWKLWGGAGPPPEDKPAPWVLRARRARQRPGPPTPS